MIERVFQIVISLTVMVWVARYLGPERMGLLSYSISFVGLFLVIAKFGLGEIIVHELVTNESQRDTILGTGFYIKVIGVLVMLLSIALTVQFTDNDAYTNILITVIAGGSIFEVFSTIDFYFQAKVLSRYSVFARSSVGIIIPSIKIVLILIQADLIWFAVVTSGGIFLQALFYIIAYKYNKLSFSKWKFNSIIAKRLLINSWPLFFTSFMIAIYMKIDQIMLKNMMGDKEVGIYAIAVRLSEFWYFVPMLITQSIFPAIIKSKKHGIKLFNSRMQQLYDLMTLLSLSLAIIVTFSARFITVLLFGEEYSGSGTVLTVHIWAGILVFYGISRSKWIIAQKLQQKAIIIHVGGAILNVVLNIILIPIYGAVGAAMATLVSFTLNTIITGVLIVEFRGQLTMFFKSFLHIVTFKTYVSLYHLVYRK